MALLGCSPAAPGPTADRRRTARRPGRPRRCRPPRPREPARQNDIRLGAGPGPTGPPGPCWPSASPGPSPGAAQGGPPIRGHGDHTGLGTNRGLRQNVRGNACRFLSNVWCNHCIALYRRYRYRARNQVPGRLDEASGPLAVMLRACSMKFGERQPCPCSARPWLAGRAGAAGREGHERARPPGPRRHRCGPA